MSTQLHALAQEENWSDNVHFLPYVGPEYDEGLRDKVRALILGDSHFGTVEKNHGATRAYTQEEFAGYIEPGYDYRTETRKIYKSLSRLVCAKVDPSPEESVRDWRRVAFANAVQTLASESRIPTNDQYKQSRLAVREMLEVLKPHVVLVLGKRLWNHRQPWLGGRWSEEEPIPDKKEARRIWLMDGPGYRARVSWIFHPSWNTESDQSAIDVFNQLIGRAAVNPFA